MSTSAISGSSLNQQIQQYFHTRQSDLHDLGKALGSGDLAAAKAAFQDIAKLGQGGPFASGDPLSNSLREQDFTAIGKALQSGDLAGAKEAFDHLKATFQHPQEPLLPPTTAPASSSGPEIILNLNNSSGNANPEQITINLNQTSGGGEQVSLSVGQQGSKAQQFTFNLPANSNEEIVLNLSAPSSTTPSSSPANVSSATTSPANGGLSVRPESGPESPESRSQPVQLAGTVASEPRPPRPLLHRCVQRRYQLQVTLCVHRLLHRLFAAE